MEGEKRTYFGVMDCNNFFVSCERVFNPSLEGKAVVVLSNNDGCAVSRSAEAKRLGIKMGYPAFKIAREFIEKGNQVFLCSSNYTLYADMSKRVMSILRSIISDVEEYSIDESFIKFEGLSDKQISEKCREIIAKIKKYTGIPVSMGVSYSKTLAKVATYYAKHYKGYKGFCFINSQEKREKALKLLNVDDVWGIGWRNSAKLKKEGIECAEDFVQMDKERIQKLMGINGVRTYMELLGKSVLSLEKVVDKQSITTSRSFAEMVSDKEQLIVAVANFAATCARKLREQRSYASSALVYVATNFFRSDLPQYSNSVIVEFEEPTNDAIKIVTACKSALDKIFRSGLKYKKAGVTLQGVIPEGQVQQNLFVNHDDTKMERVNNIIDSINSKFGKDKLHLAIQDSSVTNWKMRREHLSPNYTTNLNEIIEIKV